MAPLSQELIAKRNSYFSQALQQEEVGELKKALEFYRMALEVDKNFFEAWLNAGAIYSKQGKSEKAIKCYERALSLKADKKVFYNLAVEHFRKENFHEAKSLLEKALKQDSQFLEAYLLLSYVYGKLNQYEEAETTIRKALNLDPENSAALTALVLLYQKWGKFELAQKYLDILLRKKPKEELYLRLKAALLIEGKDLGNSIKILQDLAVSDSRIQEIKENLAKYFSDEQKRTIEQKRNKILSKQNPSKQEIIDLSLIEFFLGDPQKALKLLEKSIGEGK